MKVNTFDLFRVLKNLGYTHLKSNNKGYISAINSNMSSLQIPCLKELGYFYGIVSIDCLLSNIEIYRNSSLTIFQFLVVFYNLGYRYLYRVSNNEIVVFNGNKYYNIGIYDGLSTMFIGQRILLKDMLRSYY